MANFLINEDRQPSEVRTVAHCLSKRCKKRSSTGHGIYHILLRLILLNTFFVLLYSSCAVSVRFMPCRSVTFQHAVVGLNNIFVITIHCNCFVIKFYLICVVIEFYLLYIETKVVFEPSGL
jgi:hypothetical protein